MHNKRIITTGGLALLALTLLGAGYMFFQSPRGQYVLRCYTAFDIAPAPGYNDITCPDGELLTPVAQVTATATAIGSSATPLPPSATSSVTATPGRNTNTPAATSSPTATKPPSSTSSPTATKPPGGTLTATPIPPVIGCPAHLNEWHAPQNIACQHHHHGIDPRSIEFTKHFNGYPKKDGQPFDVGKDFLDIYGELWQPLWLSSPSEEKHGFIWGVFEDLDCNQFGVEDLGYACIPAVGIRLHDTGTLDHLAKRFHSHAMIIKGCDKLASGKPDLNQCGILVIPGVVADYGQMLAKYNDVICHLDIEPGYPFPDALAGIPSYRTSASRASTDNGLKNESFWVANTQIPIVKPYYQPPTNNFMDLSWSALDVWQFFPTLPNGQLNLAGYCDLPGGLEMSRALFEQVAPEPEFKHVTFQLIHLEIPSAPSQPGTYWYDIYGNPQPAGACQEADAVCVPYLVAGDFPAQVVLKYEAFHRRNCNVIPCFTAETGGVEMLFPLYDQPAP